MEVTGCQISVQYEKENKKQKTETKNLESKETINFYLAEVSIF